tara:strand:+ start:795 stop:1286 length:492 start_codon:yes stop_codon:yes gene_type:complete
MRLNNLITSNVGMGFDKPTMSIEDLENLNLADLEILLHLNHREMEVYGSGNLGWQLLDDSCPAEFTPEGKLRVYLNAKPQDNGQNKLRKLLSMNVREIALSPRAANCLENKHIRTVGVLATKSEQEMLECRNLGEKSLKEIKAKLEQLGLSLGMKIDERLLDN